MAALRADLMVKKRKKEKKTVANWPFTQTTHVSGSKSKFA